MAGRRILVVDDYRSIAEGLCRLLRAKGHDARCAYDGRTALVEAASFAPEIVLLDVVLPDLAGLEVARLLRAQQASPVHIVAISSCTSDATGFDQYMLKPFGSSKLDAIIARVGEPGSQPH